jgi:hypothetical protein
MGLGFRSLLIGTFLGCLSVTAAAENPSQIGQTQVGTNSGSRQNSARVQMNYGPGNPTDHTGDQATVPSQTAPADSPPSNGNSAANGPARAWAPWMALMFQGHEKNLSHVNNLLTLMTAQKFLMRIDPRLKFPRDNGDDALEPVRKGHYKISILLFTEEGFEARQFTADNLIAEYSGLVDTRFDGNVAADVTLTIHDIAGVLNRSMAVIVLEPVGEAATRAGAGVYYAPSAPLRANRVDLELRELTDAPGDIVTQLENARQRSNKSLNGVQMLPTAGYAKLNLPQSYVDAKILKNGEWNNLDGKIYPKYCNGLIDAKLQVAPEEILPRWLGETRSAQVECLHNSSRFYRIEIRDFVEKVNGIKYMPELFDRRYLNITRDLNHLVISRQEFNENINFGVYGDFGINQSVPIGKGYLAGGAKITAGANLLLMRARTREKIFNAQVHEGQYFQVYIDGYRMNLQLRRCMIIQPKMAGVRGAYACYSKPFVKNVTEKYYLLNYQVEGSPMSDNDDPDNANYRMIIRGDKAYEQIEATLTSDNDLFDLTKLAMKFSGVDEKRPLLPDLRVSQEFPGSLPINAK